MTDARQANPEVGEAQTATAVARFCRNVIELMKFDLTVEVSEEQDSVHLNLSGPDRPLLLTNTAALLNGIEYLVNKAFRTGKGAKIASIVLDSDRYRRHREAELTLLAEMAAKKVLAQRKGLTLQPMTPRERRIVHLALAGIPGVRSQSDGEGDSRSITIHPC